MESTYPRKETSESHHSHAHSHPNTAGSTIHSMMTGKSTSTSSSLARATTPSYALHTHRYHHNHSDRETTSGKQLLRLPFESSRESKKPMTPVSSLLLEKLQQERRAESERLAGHLGADPCSSASNIGSGNGLDSSHRKVKPVERKTTSSHGDDSSQGSMGAKQIEQAVSTLHKQNFDLKLELYHRREKQSALQARVEELEANRLEWLSSRDGMRSEMIKKDKAIAEAVNMIVQLEARVDELVQDREMARYAAADGSHQHVWHTASDSLRAETPKQGNYGDLLSTDSANTLERMPSFLTDRSVHTENLRSIVLQNSSGPIHLRKISQVSSSSADVSEINRVASPSLSILSESSFVSIYGPKQGQGGFGPPLMKDVSSMDGSCTGRSLMSTKKAMEKAASASGQEIDFPNRMASTTPRAVANPSGQAMPLDGVAYQIPSLPKIERLGEQLSTIEETFKSPTLNWEEEVLTSTLQLQSPGKREKGEVFSIDYSTHDKDSANVHILPPTPDTVSSSVLQKHKGSSNSQDSFSRSDDTCVRELSGTECLRSYAPMATSRHGGDLPNPKFVRLNETQPFSNLGQLAHSTAMTATAWARPDSYISDSDSDGGADAHSAGSCDYWLRESYKPDRDCTHSSTHRQYESSNTADMFSFPEDSGVWEPDAMFGAFKGDGFIGTPIAALKRDPMDEMASSAPYQSDSFKPSDGPRPPSRRSSLNAQNIPAAGRGLPRSQTFGNWGGPPQLVGDARTGGRSRSNSVDAGYVVSSGTRPDATKRSQYPPISGLQSNWRNLALNSFLRRSGTENHSARANAAESTLLPSALYHRASPTPQSHAQHLKRKSGIASVPPPSTTPWAVRPAPPAPDQGESATPPPILRNRPPRITMELTSPNTETLAAVETGALPASAEVPEATPAAPQGGGMRKWLGLGKRASLMNRSR
ncbi:hypothetical protein GGS21DRAFT_534698 [Xylaria nigripes]|nr:hypothetical protein GGS21DRAFT_534698 [Xylaria nigripes]